MMQMGPHPRAESEGDVGEEVVRVKPQLEANQPLLPAPPPQLSHQETRRVQWTPPVLQNGSTARQGRQGPGGAPGWKVQGDRHLRLWPNRALEAMRARPGSSLESARASVCGLPAESPQRPASASTPCLK